MLNFIFFSYLPINCSHFLEYMSTYPDVDIKLIDYSDLVKKSKFSIIFTDLESNQWTKTEHFKKFYSKKFALLKKEIDELTRDQYKKLNCKLFDICKSFIINYSEFDVIKILYNSSKFIESILIDSESELEMLILPLYTILVDDLVSIKKKSKIKYSIKNIDEKYNDYQEKFNNLVKNNDLIKAHLSGENLKNTSNEFLDYENIVKDKNTKENYLYWKIMHNLIKGLDANFQKNDNIKTNSFCSIEDKESSVSLRTAHLSLYNILQSYRKYLLKGYNIGNNMLLMTLQKNYFRYNKRANIEVTKCVSKNFETIATSLQYILYKKENEILEYFLN